MESGDKRKTDPRTLLPSYANQCKRLALGGPCLAGILIRLAIEWTGGKCSTRLPIVSSLHQQRDKFWTRRCNQDFLTKQPNPFLCLKGNKGNERQIWAEEKMDDTRSAHAGNKWSITSRNMSDRNKRLWMMPGCCYEEKRQKPTITADLINV